MQHLSDFRIFGFTRALFLTLALFVAACSSPEEKAQVHYETGVELLKSQETAKARLEFLNAVSLNDKLVPAWLALARIEEERQQWATLETYLDRVLDLEPDHAEALTKLARIQVVKNEIDQALAGINRAINSKGKNAELFALRGTVLMRLNDIEGAGADAERALAIDADNPDAHALMAAINLTKGSTNLALLSIDRGLLADPDNTDLLLFKLGIFERDKKYDQVELVLRKLIEGDPQEAATRLALVSLLTNLGRGDDALQEMRLLVGIKPDDVETNLSLVQLITRLQGVESARTELVSLIGKYPQTVDYRFALSEFDLSHGKIAEANATLDTIIAAAESSEYVHRARVLLARMKVNSGETSSAEKLVEQVLAEDSKNVDALAIRAAFRLEQRNFEDAIADIREALSQSPQSVQLLTLLGRALELKGDTGLAQQRYNQAVKLANFAPKATLNYVSFLERTGSLDQVETVLLEAVSRNPTDRVLLTKLGDVRLRKRDWIGAQSVADDLERADDTTGSGNRLMGFALLGQRRYSESAESFKQSLQKSPNSVSPLIGLIDAYIKGGRVDKAEELLESVLAANSNNAQAHVLLGKLRDFQTMPEKALQQYKLAVNAQPNSPVGYLALASYHVVQKQLDEAEALLIHAYDKTNGDFSVGLTLASLLQDKRDFEGAIAIYERMLEVRSDVEIVVNNLASLLTEYRTDRESYNRAYELTKSLQASANPYFQDTIGWAAYKVEDYQRALEFLQKAVRGRTESATVHYHLGMTYLALKQEQQAREHLMNARKLSDEGSSLNSDIERAIAELKG